MEMHVHTLPAGRRHSNASAAAAKLRQKTSPIASGDGMRPRGCGTLVLLLLPPWVGPHWRGEACTAGGVPCAEGAEGA